MNKRKTLVGPQLQRGRTGFNPDWKRLIAFLAAIVLGSIVATQVLANSGSDQKQSSALTVIAKKVTAF
jgi:hypothetical protein